MCQYRHHYAEIQSGRFNPEDSLKNFAGPGASKHYPPDLRLEPIHLKIDLRLDLDVETAVGVVTTTVIANDDGVQEIEFDAIDFENLVVSSSGDKKSGGVTHAYNGNKISVTWDKPFALGEKRDVTMSYEVVRPVSGLFFSKPSKEYPTKALYAATDHETERARYWLPCVDLPNVRTSLAFELTAKSEYEILANGRLLKEVKNGDGTKTVYWQLDQRCPSYLVCFAIGDFVSYDDGEFEGIPVKYFASRSSFRPEDLKRTFGRTKNMLTWMTKKLDMKFPFPKYFQFALPNFGGAMENISLVSWDDWFVMDEACAKERTWIADQVNLHEMAHSYFGDTVVVREFAHAWLKESWATYMEQCWLEDSKGRDEWMGDFYRNSTAYFTESEESYARPLVTRNYKSSWQMYDRHLYPGGACRLHTLRKQVGDEVFWRAVQDYLKTFAGKVVETEDFRKTIEKHCGRSLVKFFEQWFHSPGFPDLKIGFSYAKDKKSGTFTVEQKQVDEAKGGTPFEFKTEIGWTIGGKEYFSPVEVTRRVQEFTVPMHAEPEQVRFNPNAMALCRIEFNPGEDKLKKQLTSANDVIGRILAGVEISKTGKRSGVEAMASAYGKEEFWLVRRELVRAIADVGTEDAIRALVDIVKSEKDPMVTDMVFAQAARFRDQRICDALLGRAGEKLAPMSKMALFEAIGAQKERASFDVLVKGALEVDVHGVVRQGALRAMGASRHEGALKVLLEASIYGAPTDRSRSAAAAGLGRLASSLEKGPREKAVDRLREMVRDPQDFVRWAAGAGLRTAKAYEAIGDLEGLRKSLPLQQQVVVEKLVAAMSKGQEPKITALEKQLEEVTEKWRKLEGRLQVIETGDGSKKVRAAKGKASEGLKRQKTKTRKKTKR